MISITEALSAALEHYQAGRLPEAESLCRQILQAQPTHPDALQLLGVIAYQGGRSDVAIDLLGQAIAANPMAAEASYNLGLMLHKEGRLEEATAHYREALRLKPEYADAWNNLGNVLREQGRLAAAAAAYRQALTHQPTYAEAHNNLGVVFYEQGRLEEAEGHYRQALVLDPAFAESYSNLAMVMGAQGRLEEAATHYRQALALHPNDGTRIKLATMLPVILPSAQDVPVIRRKFEENIDALLKEDLTLADPVREVGPTNFLLAYHGCNNRELLIKMAQLYERACPSLLYTAPHCAFWRGVRKGDKIKIGFISRFLRNHSVGKAARGVLALLSRRRFSVTALFVPPVAEDEIATFVRQRADRVVLLPGNLDAARARIAEEAFDILFYQDIGMDPFTYFLAFARLAPVQCVFFGHAETSGIRSLDYYISSENIEPENVQDHYSERLVKLKAPCAYYYKPEAPASLKPRSAFGFDDADHVYLCPQALFKFHPEFDEILSGILGADPRARLVLKGAAEHHWAALLLQRFRRTMGRLADRITVLPQQPGGDFINLIAVADVMLDPPHFSGLTTSLEAFAVGTPVVTLPGEFQRSRLTLSLYNEMKMQDCVADSPARYVELAVRLGTDAKYRAKLRAKILARNKHLYEDSRVVKEYERVFLKMVKDARSSVIATSVAMK